MTLQNKNNQFLNGQSNTNGQDDVVDIFDQYGAGDSIDNAIESTVVSATPESAQESINAKSMEAVDVNEHISEVSPPSHDNPVVDIQNDALVQGTAKEKAWESEYEGGNEAKVLPKDVETKSETKVEQVIKPIIQPEEVKENVILQEKEREAMKEEGELVKNEESVITAPVAAPLKENLNAVVQKEESVPRESKNSFIQKPKQENRREFKIDPSKKTIAIVDDDVDTLDMYASIFEMADYNVIRASDGLEALSVISDHTPHLIFTGIVMPRMDGFAMMEALKQNKRTADIPVVINSHLGREADRKRAEELGAKDFIIRGFTPPREVLERIGALLLRSEYTFRFDINDGEARKLVKDLGASNFFVCPRGQEMVIKLSITDPKELIFSARFSCMDQKKKD